MDAARRRDFLKTCIGKKVRITFSDEITWIVQIDCVDSEGFLHSGPDGQNSQALWTRFENVESIEPDALT